MSLVLERQDTIKNCPRMQNRTQEKAPKTNRSTVWTVNTVIIQDHFLTKSLSQRIQVLLQLQLFLPHTDISQVIWQKIPDFSLGCNSFQTKLTTLTDQSVYIEIYCNMHHLGISGDLRTRIYFFKGDKISKAILIFLPDLYVGHVEK